MIRLFLFLYFFSTLKYNATTITETTAASIAHISSSSSLSLFSSVFGRRLRFYILRRKKHKKKLCDGIVVINKNSRLLFLYALTLFLCIFKLHAFGARKYLKCRSIIYVFCGFILLCNMSYWFY